MTRHLRQRHRRIISALAVFLPIAFIGGLAARKSVPIVDSVPAEFAPSLRFNAPQWERNDLFTKAIVKVRLLREAAGSGRFAVALEAAKDFARPDVLVYWVDGKPAANDALPSNAILLGVFTSATALPLPDEASRLEGALILFSLADNEIVEISKPIRLASSTP